MDVDAWTGRQGLDHERLRNLGTILSANGGKWTEARELICSINNSGHKMENVMEELDSILGAWLGGWCNNAGRS